MNIKLVYSKVILYREDLLNWFITRNFYHESKVKIAKRRKLYEEMGGSIRLAKSHPSQAQDERNFIC